MAPSGMTAIRVPVELRDEIARLAHERSGTMLDVVTDAIHRLTKDQWWESVHDAVDAMAPGDGVEYRANADQMDDASTDGLRAH